MANTIKNNVIYVDTTGYVKTNNTLIKSIRYVGITTGTALITAPSGENLFEASGVNNETAEVCINAISGINVALTNGAKVYIYLK